MIGPIIRILATRGSRILLGLQTLAAFILVVAGIIFITAGILLEPRTGGLSIFFVLLLIVIGVLKIRDG